MSESDDAVDAASALLQLRRDRLTHFPANIFHDPAWDILLELFVADAEGRQLTGKALCESHRIPLATGLRWIRHLSDLRLIVGGARSELDTPLRISPTANRSMQDMFAKASKRDQAYHHFTLEVTGSGARN